MAEIRAVFFWMGGVISPSIPAILSKALIDSGHPQVNLPGLPEFQQLCDELTLGKMDDIAFCQAICEKIDVEIKSICLKDKILASITAKPRVIQTIDLLPETYQRWLIIDYPQNWFDQVQVRLGIFPCFSSDKLFFLSRSGLKKVIPDVFDLFPHISRALMDQCLIVDENAKRSIQTLNHGLPAAAFVDDRRLEREFVLRKFISHPQPAHRPTL